jgi:Terminase large subunit, ATPase domain/Terminase large subunit, endonuclease domain
VTGRLTPAVLERWRSQPTSFIEEALHDPETGRPFKLLPAERAFLEHAFKTDADGRLLYPEQLFSAPKKSGKTAFASLHALTTALLFGGRFPEVICAANDFDQAQGRVFEALRKIIECSPLLKAEAKITSDKIIFPAIGAMFTAIPSDYAGAAGGNPTISIFDELWAYTTERSRRLWDELVPPPTRKIACRLTVTYAGFEGESALLEELHKRGLAQPLVGPDLYAGDGLLMFWSTTPIAPWQTPQWIEQMRGQLRPAAFLRMLQNQFVTTETSFVDPEWWDACVDPSLRPVVITDKTIPVWIGVDASTKHDTTAIVAVTFEAKKVRLVAHKVFKPSPDQPLDFEATIESTLKDYCRRFSVRRVVFDPWQMQTVAQRLKSAGIPIYEFPQSVPNLTSMGSCLFDLIRAQGIVIYPDPELRLAVQHTIAKEGPRGLQLTKQKSSHKIDVVIALAMAALHAVEQGSRVEMFGIGGCKAFNAEGVTIIDSVTPFLRPPQPSPPPALPAALADVRLDEAPKNAWPNSRLTSCASAGRLRFTANASTDDWPPNGPGGQAARIAGRVGVRIRSGRGANQPKGRVRRTTGQGPARGGSPHRPTNSDPECEQRARI